MISDSSAREIYKDAMVFVSDNSPLKGELKIEKETREEYLDCGNVCATFTYTGGGRIVRAPGTAHALRYIVSRAVVGEFETSKNLV